MIFQFDKTCYQLADKAANQPSSEYRIGIMSYPSGKQRKKSKTGHDQRAQTAGAGIRKRMFLCHGQFSFINYDLLYTCLL